MGLKNNKFIYECKECQKRWLIPINGLIKKSPIEMKKTKVKMNQPIYLGMSILHTSKTLAYKFWHNYIKAKY